MLKAKGFLVDEHKRKHFRTLLYLGILLLPIFSALDAVEGLVVSAAIEGALAVFFVIALVLLQLNMYIKQTIYATMVAMLLGGLGIMWYDDLMVVWISVITVMGFGFVGTTEGRIWAGLTIVCVMMLFALDLMSASPTYSMIMAVNLVVSCLTLAFIVDYAYNQIREEHVRLLQETAKRERLEFSKRFSENMAHLINNEMQGVIGLAEMMQFDAADERQHQHLESIIHNAEKTSQHANQLAIFAEQKKGVFRIFDFQVLVESVLQAWQAKLPEHIQVHLSWATGLTPCKGDALLLKDIIFCVLHNAEEAIGRVEDKEQGEISVEICVEVLANPCETRQLAKGKYIVLSVADDGCGVSKTLRDKLFEPFVTTEFIGRGMGLATALSAIKQHEGHIEFETREGVGTVFKIWLPLVEKPV